MSIARQNSLAIQTPEGIVFSLVLAGPVSRFLACLVDLFCVLAAMSVLGTCMVIFNVISPDFAQALTVLMYFVLQVGYGMGCEWYWRGQTIGKRLLRLRVVDAQGLKLRFNQIALRNLLRVVDLMPAFYMVGGIACLLSVRAQRLGDIAANTIVIRVPSLTQPDLDQLMAGKYNSLRNHPHLEARLRQRVGPREAALALQALLRREDLEAAARVALFAEMAAHFRSIVEFPPETVEGQSDEQYVRNVVDTLYRPRDRRDGASS